ncbi:AAA family ATPase [Lasiodiplodia theobromae]|uniref:AAA family ATPase n=1 Tax=Lasiodiplodia theobromae TaxID=45133 RepID=UPI0015C2F1FC|nr:AAA family ATPase [Lasiodiplodia theobromae]KAF4541302.1 AAA family ATPase [Lasiodiplodia theobromae]
MDSNEADPEIPESHAPDHHPEVARATQSAPIPAIEKGDATDKAEQPDTAMRDNHKPLGHDYLDIGDEIQALKAKILELEHHAKATPDVPTQESSNPQLMTEMEQYKRMEACLYRHRKEWERAGGPQEWHMRWLQSNGYHIKPDGYSRVIDGPWRYHWPINSSRDYNRPDPFDSTHVCADGQYDTEPPHFDDFDHTIDYGSRRERLRKNFEWEMDRLYLVEEMERRKMEKSQEKHIPQDEKPKKDEQPREQEPKPPAIELNRFEWFNFKRSTSDGGFVIEVLEGEPILDDLGPYRSCRHEIKSGQDEEDQDEEEKSTEDDEDGKDKKDEEDDTKSPMALEHLKCLLRFVDSDISTRRTYLDDPSCRKIVFSDLWLLFRPGIEVIGTDGKQAYRVVHTTSAKHRVTPAWQTWLNHSAKKRKDSPFSITCVYIDFNGRDLGPVQRVFDFKKFDGETEIVSLEVYPLRFHPAKESNFSEIEWKELATFPTADRHRQRLINRGAKFLEVAAVKHMYYAGPTLEVRDEVESQVVIDFETAFSTGGDTGISWKPELKPLVGIPTSEEDTEEEEEYPCNAECCNRQSVHDDSYVDQKQRDEYVESLLPKGSASDEQPSIAIIPRPLRELRTGYEKEFSVSDDELVIMSYRVFGFVLRSRKWAKLDLSHLSEAHPPDLLSTTTTPQGLHEKTEANKSTTAFGRLVLEKGHKRMIESLVAQHFRDKQSKAGRREEFDIVRGKGKGLILLLHGAPGVGKTSTAEGVAEIFKKPLFQITCGDLGTTASEVERALETNFSLANRWDCILLLDEADVFLAERSKEDFQRNGLVAVFLRVMEYYAGVLFLTTNRVGDFDEAFTSRIHISLYYPELSQAKTESIFKLNMDMIQERFKQNGRKIKINTFDIGSFATKHFSDHPEARWNGRQIRNACQTALALAEYEAQGNSHAATPKPDIEVELNVEHFEVVRNAYLEFTKYMNDLYENENTLGGSRAMDRAAFAFASQIPHQQQQQQQQQHQGFPQAPPSHYHQRMSSQMVQPQRQQEQPYSSYQNPTVQQSNYPERSRTGVPPHNPAPDQCRSNVTGGMAYPSFDGSQQGYDQTYAPRQPSPMTTAARQQEHPANPPWLRDSIHSMYEPSGGQSTGQAPPGSVSPGPVGYMQGNPT